MITSAIDIWSLWYEAGGLSKLRIDEFFTGFRLISIFLVTSIPFWLSFRRENHDISDAFFSINLVGLWIYYTITYFIMAWFMIKPIYKKIDTLIKNRDLFDEAGINIETTEGIDLAKLIQLSSTTKEEFLVEANRHTNVLLALEDKKYLETSVFTNLLGTLPLEIMTRSLIEEHYFNSLAWSFDHRDGNTAKISSRAKRAAIVILPFLPTLIIFSIVNHIFTYIHNGSFLTHYDYNRVGLWKFRYYNEFLFQTKKRLAKTKSSAEAITVNLFLESWKASVFKCCSYMLSAFSGTLLVFSFFGYEWIWGMDVITLSACFGFLSAMMFPKPKNQDGSMSTLRSVLKKDLSRYELGNYFESKMSILFKEILSILYIPIALYWIVPNRAYFIADFMLTYYKEGKCTFAKWNNKDATPKTRISFQNMSLDIENSDLVML